MKTKRGRDNAAKRILAQRLRQWRKDKRHGLKVIVADLQVSASSWNAWENGTRFPNGENLVAISEYTGIPICRLFCRHYPNTCADCRDTASSSVAKRQTSTKKDA